MNPTKILAEIFYNNWSLSTVIIIVCAKIHMDDTDHNYIYTIMRTFIQLQN